MCNKVKLFLGFATDYSLHEFVCKKCGKAYKRKSSLYNHNRWECGKEPQFKCSYCPYRGKQKIHFIMHMIAKHKEHKSDVLKVTQQKE